MAFLSFQKRVEAKHRIQIRSNVLPHSSNSSTEKKKSTLRLPAPSSSSLKQENIPQTTTVDEPTRPLQHIHEKPKRKSTLRSPASSSSSLKQKNIARPTTVDEPIRPSQHIHEKPKRKVLPQDDDNNFFGTPSPPPSSPAANSIVKGQPPTLRESPFRISLKRIRATSGNVTNDEPWPPKRRKQDTGEISRDLEPSGVVNTRGKVETKRADSTTLSAAPAQVNPVASSSKVLLPDPPHRHASHPKPTTLLKMIYAKGAPSSDTSHKLPNGLTQTIVNNRPRSVSTDAAMKGEKSSLIINERKHEVRVTSSGSQNSMPINPMPHPTTFPNGDTAALRLTRISTVDADDPFVANNKPLGSTTPPVRDLILDKPPRIDLRQSLSSATRRSNISSRASTSSTSRHSTTPFLLPEDQEIVDQLGFSEVMTIIAKNYGFDVSVAMNTFFATKSIKKTKSMLQYAKEVTNSAMSALLALQGDGVDSCSDEEPQSVQRDLSASGEKIRNAGYQKAKQSSDSRKAKRTSLKFKPQVSDEEIALSDYSPPSVSRAGQFMRLVKQGRRKEAVDRERRRSSGMFVAQTQTQNYEDQRQLPSSPLSNSSPTLNSVQQQPMDVDTCDDDDFQPPIVVVAPNEDDTVQNQPDRKSTRLNSSHSIASRMPSSA